jgi:trigger factor
MELMYRGMDPQKIEENLAEIRSNTTLAAANELKLYFVLDKIAEKLDVKVTEGELNQRIAQIAFSRGERPERVRQEIIARNQIGMVYTQLREHKTVDQILARAKVEELSVEEFSKHLGVKGGDEAKPAKPKPAAKKPEPKDDDDAPKAKPAKGKK